MLNNVFWVNCILKQCSVSPLESTLLIALCRTPLKKEGSGIQRGIESAPITGGYSKHTCTGDGYLCLRSLTPPISPGRRRKRGHCFV